MSETDPGDTLSRLILAYIPARAVQVAAELGVADLIATGVTTIEGLAQATRADPGTLRRLMRYLVGLDLFDESETGYSLKAMGELLRGDVEGSYWSAARLSAFMFPAWVELGHAVRTGEAGYHKYFGKPIFDHLAEDPERAAVFDTAMTALYAPETAAILDACDLSDVDTVIDVGGGNGSFMMEMLGRYPSMHGVIFDLPHVTERAFRNVEEVGLGERCRTVGGSFFEAIPEGADAIVLRHVIHDWPDEDAVRILANCERALAPGGRVLVVEMLLADDGEASPAKRFGISTFDLTMMVLYEGAERTEAEYRALFEAAGLTLAGTTPTTSPSYVIEGRTAARAGSVKT
jgi:SAM-dependent methyltransferase